MGRTNGPPHPSAPNGVQQWLREPLLHFLVLGAVLFAIYGYRQRGTVGEPSRQIALTADDVRQLANYYASNQHRTPTSEELDRLIQNKIQEEVLYREALALGLDKDDAVVKSRLAEKMQFLVEGEAAVNEPTTAELKSWFEKNIARFAIPERVSFRHLYFAADHRGANAKADADKALAEIATEKKDSKLATSQGDPFMFQAYYGEWSPDELTKDFGPAFGNTVAKLKPGSWQGPIQSDHGWHLIFVDSMTPARTPTLDEMESEVKSAWLEEQSTQAWRKAYDALRAKYSITIPPPSVDAPDSRPLPSKPIDAVTSSSGESQ